ncbi:MAG: EAL domain-containing protein [Burkholderiales bacterium]|nr:EAL domain-containing protein [Burkholderiales bacterium]
MMHSTGQAQRESERVSALRALEILDTAEDAAFDNLTQLACAICGTPTALVSLVDSERTWFKSRVGYPEAETPRRDSFCNKAIEKSSPLVVEDASVHPDFKDNVHVVAQGGLRAYAGIPLMTSSGFTVGVLCVLDRIPRSFTELQISSLALAAKQVVVLLEQHKIKLRLTALERESFENEQRLNFALDAAEIGDWNMDLRTNIAVRSLQHDRCFGYTDAVQDWGYDTFLGHVDERDRDRVDAAFKAAMAGQGTYDVVFRVTWPDQTLHWLWSKGSFYFDDAGAPCRVAGIQADVTARINSERALSASNSRYQLLYENSLSAILQTATDGQVLFANPAACKLFGMTEEQLRNLGRGGLVRNRDSRLAELLNQRAQNGSTHGQLTMVKADGSEFEADISSNIYTDKEGVERASVIVADISEKLQLLQFERQQHERLKAAEEHHRTLLHHLSSGIVVHAPDTRILFSNVRASELLGLTVEQLNGKMAIDPDWQFVYEDGKSIPLAEYPVNKVISTLAPMPEMILGVRRPDRVDLVWLLGHAFPEFDSQGQLKQVIVNFHDVTQRKNAETQTWTEANFDHLTRLPNRRLFHDRLEQALRQSQRDKSTTVLMFLDLDHFKDVNDSQGHDIGDKLLIEVAHRIKGCVRDSDTLARLGGDEFTVILTDLHGDRNVGQIASKIISALSQPYLLAGQETFMSASIGIAIYPEDGDTSSDLLKHADQALYVAKNEGRSCFRFFTNSMQVSAVARMQLTNDLRYALRDKQFELFYQPIIDLVTGHVGKAEALIRWHHPKRGLVSPGVFIPLAEESGAIHHIGDWVFHEAAREVSRLATARPGFQISINKSPVQFRGEDDLHTRWIAHLNQLELPGSSIVIEITEGLLMESNPVVSERLLKFRDAGIQVALDDFGTGYSSLAYLKKFDIDFLKIDQSFTRNLAPMAPDLALCEAIVVMAHKLGLKVIAEGVETQEQLDLLRQIGCDCGQGYFFARPMPLPAFEKFLQDNAPTAFTH